MVHRRVAIAEFRGNIGIARNARHRLEPGARHQTGIERRTAGADGDAIDLGQIEWQLRQTHRAGAGIDQLMQRVAQHGGVLVQFLFHEMAEIALADGSPGQRGEANVALDLRPAQVMECRPIRAHHHPVAVFQIGDATGERGQCQGVGAQEHLALAEPHRQGCAVARTDQQAGMTGEHHGERIGPVQPPERLG